MPILEIEIVEAAEAACAAQAQDLAVAAADGAENGAQSLPGALSPPFVCGSPDSPSDGSQVHVRTRASAAMRPTQIRAVGLAAGERRAIVES